jgi:DNA repair exonuclease SbcCD nuclease subunit
MVRFITGYETEEAPFPDLEVLVHGIPHGALTNPDPPAVLLHQTWRNIAVTHGVAPGVEFRAGREAGEVQLRGNVLDTRFDYVALGHIHLRQTAGINAWYSGSTERTSWGDEPAEPGYALVTLGERGGVPQVEYIDVPARPMETLQPISGKDRDGNERLARDLADQILARAGALNMPDAMVRVELQNTSRPLVRETDAILRRETGSIVWHIRLTIPGDLIDSRDPRLGPPIGPLLTEYDKFIDQNVERGEYDVGFERLMRGKGRSILEGAVARFHEASTIESGSL